MVHSVACIAFNNVTSGFRIERNFTRSKPNIGSKKTAHSTLTIAAMTLKH